MIRHGFKKTFPPPHCHLKQDQIRCHGHRMLLLGDNIVFSFHCAKARPYMCTCQHWTPFTASLFPHWLGGSLTFSPRETSKTKQEKAEQAREEGGSLSATWSQLRGTPLRGKAQGKSGPLALGNSKCAPQNIRGTEKDKGGFFSHRFYLLGTEAPGKQTPTPVARGACLSN